MKKIYSSILFMVAFLMISTTQQAHAASQYTEGLLYGMKGSTTANGTPTITQPTDGSLSTSYRVAYGGYYYTPKLFYAFDEPVTITSHFMKESGVAIKYRDNRNRLIEAKDYPVHNIVRVELNSTAPQDSKPLYAVEVYGGVMEKPDPVKELKATGKTSRSIDLSWDYGKAATQARIYLNGKQVKDTVNGKTFTITGLEPETDYTIGVSAISNLGVESDGTEIKAKTEEAIIEDVTSLKAKPDEGRIDLSWKNPDSYEFQHVNIYRKTIDSKTSYLKGLLINTAHADEDYKAIFETNGTYFNDLTVEPVTTYEYRLTTQNRGEIESDGVTVRATTPKETVPPVDGIKEEKDENGDYIYTWEKPTSGQVKVVVGGKVFSTVPASDGRIKIPAADMKYKTFGDPDVQLIPITEKGTEGGATDPNGGQIGGNKILPFAPDAVLSGTTALLAVVAPLIVLWLVVWFARVRLIPLIKKTADQKKPLHDGRRST